MTRAASAGLPGASRLPLRLASCGLALLLAAPLAATVWTRANVQVRIPKSGRAGLENVSYSGRDWSAALTAFEVRQAAGRGGGGDEVSTLWTFHYTNSDREAHYVGLTVRCLDAQRREVASFKAVLTLLADRPSGAAVEQTVRIPENAWSRATVARIVADFLSGPEG